jgi:fermentation-respiration switch protein FrsA (DUF1100 family)
MNMKSLTFVLIFVTLAVSGCGSLINRMAFHPDKESSIPQDKLPQGVQEIFIDTTDGVKIQSYFIPDKSSKKIVIFFHGNAGNIAHRLVDLLQIRESGVNVLGVGYRGYGKSEGKPNEKGIYRDGESALAYAIAALGFNINDIYIFGRSIGTTVAIHTAQEKDLAGLILVTPLTSGKEQAKAMGLNSIAFLAGGSFNNIEKIQNITCPVLVIHGDADRVIPYRMSVEIYEKIQTEKELITICGAGHNNISADFNPQYWESISGFINKGYDYKDK